MLNIDDNFCTDLVFTPTKRSDDADPELNRSSFRTIDERKVLTSKRCLLHIAATRAKKLVFVSYFGNPSNFLELTSYP